MCGITGFIGQGNQAILGAMMAAIRHRGPDASGKFVDPAQAVYLGHQRLEILDIEGGKQPFFSADGNRCIVFNGEIYNHMDLRQELLAKGLHFRTDHSDTETLLQAFQAWGPAMQKRLNGMWAFAIYDRQKRQLFLSRDRFGQKPLFYAHYGDGFAFASELQALLHHPKIHRDQDLLGLQKFYAHGYLPGHHTQYQAIKKLLPGHQLTLRLSDLNLKREQWWQFQLEPQPLFSSEHQWQQALDEALERAVARRLMADVPLGVLLSGGIDSSTIAWYAQKVSSAPIKSFALGFEQKSFDERKPAQLAANHIGTQHHQTTLTWVDAAASMAGVSHNMDELLGDSSLIPTAHLCQFTRKQVKVALGGDGADELFAGYDPFRALTKARLYARFMPSSFHRALRWMAKKLPVSQKNMAFGFKLNKALEGLDPPTTYMIPRWMAPLPPKEIAELFQTKVEPEILFEESRRAWQKVSDHDLVGKCLQFFTQLYLNAGVLTKVDRASMMHGLEVRSPFLDIDLVDLVRRMPHHLKLRGQTTKYMLKKTMAQKLPSTLLTRPKKGFGMPVGTWFKQGQLSFTSNSQHFKHNPALAKTLYQDHVRGKKDSRLFLWCYWVHHHIMSNQLTISAQSKFSD